MRIINQSAQVLNKAINYLLWGMFFGVLAYLVCYYPNIPEWHYRNILKVNGFTLLIWTVVLFFSALISSYAKKYLRGFKYHTKFSLLSLGFTGSIVVFVMANHTVLFVLMWCLMGWGMSQLIGIDSRWAEARAASKFALGYFTTGSFFLCTGVFLLAFQTGDFTLSGMLSKLDNLPPYITLLAGLCIISAAIIQSAIYPFHRWLLSAMTAPTPASALMHAGFVNGSGILLTIFSTVLLASNTLIVLFIIGGLTAIIAQFTKLLQVNVKQKLACSTIAQMGFMIMQCGLGFFNAAVVHLILHGFYKAYLFLSAGEEIGNSKPQRTIHIKIKPFQAVIVLVFGVLGAFMFAYLTGKGFGLNSGIFLTLIVAITVGQATYNIVKEKSLRSSQKAFLPPVLFVFGILSYTLVYNIVTTLMEGMPLIEVSLPLSWIEVLFGMVFLTGFFIMKLGVYRKYPALYVKLLNISQPYKKTVLMYKSKSL
jgi:NAD(P)H-quinone oxidoreductase subunit 5